MTLKNLLFVAGLAVGVSAQASPLTVTSPTGGALPSSVSAVGGIVIDLTGTSGNRLLTQAAASSLFIGDQNLSPNLLIGTQAGFTPSVVAALGGGITAASVRVSLYDGDNQSGNFDFQNDGLTLNGVAFGNFSSVATNRTTPTGTFISASLGFGNETFDTGWFTVSNAATLGDFYASLSSGKVDFRVTDTTIGAAIDQFYDFTRGVDRSLIDVGSPPVITPSIPEPSTYALLGLGLAGVLLTHRAKRKGGERPQ